MPNLLDSIDWVQVPAGEVQLGTPMAELPRIWRGYADLPVQPSWFLKECPCRTVQVPAFAIARVPLSIRRYAALADPLDLPAAQSLDTAALDHPVPVDYATAQLLATRLAAATGAPVGLPHEVQWERAARGDDTREFPWGDRFDADRANIGEGSAGGTTPVGSYPLGASPYGVLDLAGNLDEWTRTVYAPYPGAPAEVPVVEDWALDPHVTRGGGWNHQRDAARCARRHGLYDDGPVGVRLVLAEPGCLLT
jgi:toxoflavin biosynthesis protein ToxD